ncbi:hypothetical protein VTO42DRAFT_2369 [Malbranchea cinnamomea]
MLSNVPRSMGRKRVFESVFPPLRSNIVPSHEPASGSVDVTATGKHSDVGYVGYEKIPQQLQQQSGETGCPPERAIWDRAWDAATTYLSIPEGGFNFGQDGDGDGNGDDLDEETLMKRWEKEPPSQFVSDSIFYVGADASPGRELRAGLKECDLREWYMVEARKHFLRNFRDGLIKELNANPSRGALQRVVRYLRLAQNIYFSPFKQHILPLIDPVCQDQAFTKLQQSLHAVISYSLPAASISALLTEELTAECAVVLGVHHGEDDGDGMDLDSRFNTSYDVWRQEPSEEGRRKMMVGADDIHTVQARSRLMQMLEDLQSVGLGGRRAQKVFAEVMNDMLTEFVTSTYTSQWESPSLATAHLGQWIENVFAKLVADVLQVLKTTDGQASQTEDVALSDVGKWQEIGIARLGSLRISELFDIIVEWDSSKGAIEDLKHYILNPPTRVLLASSFHMAIVTRLLHPGASTVEILQLYISMIRAFSQLDPRGVLLDKVARPIRRYLRDRDDTVKVIVGGLLSEQTDSENQDTAYDPEKLPELARELSDAHQQALRGEAGELDWDDMNWVPDPVDAAPDYKKSKTDVIGSLISLFDSKEVFVKELQKVLSERLLKKKRDYETEISVLELLKLRFGDSSLQACEVMLRDIVDSKRVDNSIRAEQQNDDTMVEDTPELHAKILSRLYWPSLSDLSFKIPDEIRALQEKYAAGFESLKPSRKLTWLNGLGRVTVELDFEDRLFQDEVTTWQASVIYAFQSPTTPSSTVTKTVAELAEQLSMSASLVRSACLFWVSKRVLAQTKPDTFSVLETLPEDGQENPDDPLATIHASNSASQAAHHHHHHDGAGPSDDAAAAAAAAQEEAEKEAANAEAMAKMDFYWQFIVGMLTNQGAMPLQRIIMMLKIVVPGGFPFSSEELKGFLAQKVAQGRLEILGGGNYKIVK